MAKNNLYGINFGGRVRVGNRSRDCTVVADKTGKHLVYRFVAGRLVKRWESTTVTPDVRVSPGGLSLELVKFAEQLVADGSTDQVREG